MVPRSADAKWHKLPRMMAMLQTKLNEKCPLVVTCYNKLKHGPQMVISRIRDALLTRGHKNADLLSDTKYVRLLFQGAMTENGSELLIAPFLLHQPYCVNGVFYEQMLPMAIAYWSLASWSLCTQFTKSEFKFADKRLPELMREASNWKKQVEWNEGEEMPDIFQRTRMV
jgi:hypothetical protein